MRKLLPAAVVVLFAAIAGRYFGADTNDARDFELAPHTESATPAADTAIAAAWRDHLDDVQVEGIGTVTRVLADDDIGDRHQRFVVALDSGQTLLIAHNIDLAPRVPDLRAGDRVGFYGQYEWNEQGGIVHWTHADPAGRRVGGWLDHDGRRYR